MAVFGYSMRSIKETESERETREETGKEEKRKRLIENVQNRKYRRGQLIGWIGTSLTPASGNDRRISVGLVRVPVIIIIRTVIVIGSGKPVSRRWLYTVEESVFRDRHGPLPSLRKLSHDLLLPNAVPSHFLHCIFFLLPGDPN